MPVDFIVILLPIFFGVSVLIAICSKKRRKPAVLVSLATLVAFLGLYLLPGWKLAVKARKGDLQAQYDLGEYYWTRCGYMWSDIDSRDKWWRQAAEGGHPHAMYQVGYFSQYGASEYIPLDPNAAKEWIRAAAAKGDDDAKEWLEAAKSNG